MAATNLERARTLTTPPASIIYTFPVALRYSLDFPHIQNNFDRVFVLPNVNLVDHAGVPDPEGRQTMAEIFHRRLNPDRITAEALQTLIDASGGLIGTLIRLGGLATEHALVDGQQTIDLASAQKAIAEMRGDFKALLRDEDYAVLERAAAGDDLTNTAGVREVLYTGSLLEYHNGEPWFGVHPLVRPLLED